MSIRTRAREIVTEFFANPTLPILGWTKTVETIVAGGLTENWTKYSLVVTIIWVCAHEIQYRAAEAADDVTDAVDEATEGLTDD